MSQETLSSSYFDHYFGLTILMAETPDLKYDQSEITLSAEHSKKFCVGIARKKSRGTTPFLAGHLDDWTWLNQINWKRIVIDTQREKLCLITSKMSFPSLPTLTSMSIAIQVGEAKKLEALKKTPFSGIEALLVGKREPPANRFQ